MWPSCWGVMLLLYDLHVMTDHMVLTADVVTMNVWLVDHTRLGNAELQFFFLTFLEQSMQFSPQSPSTVTRDRLLPLWPESWIYTVAREGLRPALLYKTHNTHTHTLTHPPIWFPPNEVLNALPISKCKRPRVYKTSPKVNSLFGQLCICSLR